MQKNLKAAVLKYPKESPAPFLVAKGKGEIAQQILKIALENNIPLVKNVAETEIITLQEIGECIPEETYEVLAKIFAFIKNMENSK